MTLIKSKTCGAGESGFEVGGAQAHRDHLGSHIALLSRYLGASRLAFIE
ncbi:hypothetical protein [Shewanella sp.]